MKFRSKSFQKSVLYALNGLRIAFKSQRNFRKHLLMGICLLLVAFLLKLGVVEICIVILVNVLVLICELFNSIIEFILDAYYKNNWAKLAKISKDLGAGVVLISSVNAVTICTILFAHKLFILSGG